MLYSIIQDLVRLGAPSSSLSNMRADVGTSRPSLQSAYGIHSRVLMQTWYLYSSASSEEVDVHLAPSASNTCPSTEPNYGDTTNKSNGPVSHRPGPMHADGYLESGVTGSKGGC